MITAAYVILAFLLTRTVVAIINLFSGRQLNSSLLLKKDDDQELISVLIPARNEEKNIGNLLSELKNQEYQNFEILVYDDLSTDKTAKIVASIAESDNRIKLIKGRELPKGWLGKNHACHQLALNSKGKYMLFIDADIKVTKSVLQNTLSHLKNQRVDLLSIFPVQIMKTPGEKITVPVMNWVLTGLLPLILTLKSTRPSLSAANGQFMLFKSKTYFENQFHEKVKEHKAEDIRIFKLMKKAGYRSQTILSNGEVSCRMYNSFKEAIIGFSKNVVEFFGGSEMIAILFAIITTFGFIPVLLSLQVELIFLYFVTIIVQRTIISYISRQPVVTNILLAPVQQIMFLLMVISAIASRHKRTLLWKGRNIYNTG